MVTNALVERIFWRSGADFRLQRDARRWKESYLSAKVKTLSAITNDSDAGLFTTLRLKFELQA